MHHIYEHMFARQVAQDAVTVIGVLNDTIGRIKAAMPDVTEIFMRSGMHITTDTIVQVFCFFFLILV